MKNLLLLVFVIAACWKVFGGDKAVELGPGVKVTDAPKQTIIEQPQGFDFKNYQITPLASFAIKAKVLSKNNYMLGRESDVSPMDLALGWQQMSDEAVLNKIIITQSSRWYHWQVNDFPIPRSEIETQSANMHLIPATDAVESTIKQVKQGEIIEMRGYLVRVDGNDGWRWLSSLTRNDIGAHACELVYVESFTISAAR
tara:strand:- start:26981 stop:27577 length:597 start_codon:yes stop_codon:yes gene_type:complete